MEISAQIFDLPRLDRQVLVVEPVDAREHAREDLMIEALIVCCGPDEELFPAAEPRQFVDIGEIPSFGPAEQGKRLACSQITWAQGGTQFGVVDRFFRRAVNSQIYDQALLAIVDLQTDEITLVDDAMV